MAAPVKEASTKPPTFRVQASSSWFGLNLREMWEYRDLLYFLTTRDIRVRYKQTILGVGWAIIQPFMTMVVFSLFFGYLAKVPSEGVPYPIFSYAALLPWSFFSQALTSASTSLVGNSNLLTKVYFPRLIMPLAGVLGGLVDFAVAFVVLLGMMLFYGIAPTRAVVLLPVFLLLAILTALGVSLWLSALNVEYRDVQFVIPFIIQFWLFATPVAYSSSLLPEPWRTVYALNPMVGVVEGFRWAMLGTKPPESMIALAAVMTLLILATGWIYFRRMEDNFADVV